MAYAADLKSAGLRPLWVRPPPALFTHTRVIRLNARGSRVVASHRIILPRSHSENILMKYEKPTLVKHEELKQVTFSSH